VAIICNQILKTKEKKRIFDIPNNNKLKITIKYKFNLIHSSFNPHEDIVQTRDIAVQVIFRHQL